MALSKGWENRIFFTSTSSQNNGIVLTCKWHTQLIRELCFSNFPIKDHLEFFLKHPSVPVQFCCTQPKISINSECFYIACFPQFSFFSVAGVRVCRMCSISSFPRVTLCGNPKLISSDFYQALLAQRHCCKLHQVWTNSILMLLEICSWKMGNGCKSSDL